MSAGSLPFWSLDGLTRWRPFEGAARRFVRTTRLFGDGVKSYNQIWAPASKQRTNGLALLVGCLVANTLLAAVLQGFLN